MGDADGATEGALVLVEVEAEVEGSADGARVGRELRDGSVVRVPWAGVGVAGSGAVIDGVRVGVGSGAEGLLAGGGAMGTAGEAGPSEPVSRRGSTTRAATPQVRAAPAAARRTRRRVAPRRIAS